MGALSSVLENDARLRELFLRAPLAVSVQEGAEHTYVLANEPYCNLLGGQPLAGRPRRDVMPDGALLSEILERVYTSGEPYTARETMFRVVRHEGAPLEEAYFHVLCQPTLDADGRPDGVVTFLVETSEGVRSRRYVELLAADLQRALATRDQFLSLASHELRTPLTTLVLQVQAMRKMALADALPADVAIARIDVLQRQLDQLQHLVDDVLDVSRLDDTNASVAEDVDLREIVDGAISRYAPQINRAGCTLSLRAPEPLLGMWQRAKLEQVLGNLLSNAIKYGYMKPIEIGATRDGEQAILTARDHGIGISLDQQERIFDRFERAVPASQYGGLGVGLWVVREHVKRMGGTVTVTSDPGQGALFRVALPFRDPRSSQRP